MNNIIYFDLKKYYNLEEKNFLEKIFLYKRSSKWRYLLNIPTNSLLLSFFMLCYKKKLNVDLRIDKIFVNSFLFNTIYITTNEVWDNLFLRKYNSSCHFISLTSGLIISSIFCLSFNSFNAIFSSKLIFFSSFYFLIFDLSKEIFFLNMRNNNWNISNNEFQI